MLSWQFGQVQSAILEHACAGSGGLASQLRAYQHSIVQLTDLLHAAPRQPDTWPADTPPPQQSLVGAVRGIDGTSIPPQLELQLKCDAFELENAKLHRKCQLQQQAMQATPQPPQPDAVAGMSHLSNRPKTLILYVSSAVACAGCSQVQRNVPNSAIGQECKARTESANRR